MKVISLCVPCYNEEDNVELMYEALTKVMLNLTRFDYEIVFIDNCSTDSTRTILRKVADKDKKVKVIFNLRNFGPNRSGAYGFFQATGDAVISLACDFQNPPEMIPEFIKLWENGAKVVWGRKESSEESALMWYTRSLYYKIIATFSEVKQYTHITGFGLYDREVIENMKALGDPVPNFRNQIPELGYEVDFIDFVQPLRERGKSSYNLYRYFEAALSSLVNTSLAPLRMATFAGFLVGVLSLLIGMIYLFLKLLFWNSFLFGTAPILIGLFFIGGVQLMFIGLLGEYIGEILTRVTNRPMVIEKERINFE